MAKLNLTVCTWDYDRVRPIIDGRVPIEGCEIKFLVLTPEECFRRAYGFHEFEVSEIGFGPYLIAYALKQNPYVALPIFLSRMFRHSSIYIRTDRGIRRPVDLKGKVVGVGEYQMSAVMWCRGMLADNYGVKPGDMIWRQGGINVPGRKEKFALNLPPGFPLKPIPDGQTLNTLFAAGELDALISPEVPACYRDGRTPVTRMFEDYESAEREYYRQTKVFPIMHALGVRNDIYEKHPWLAAELYRAFAEAKRLSDLEFQELRALKVGLPWVTSQAQTTAELMGADFWPYGIKANRHTLEVMTRYSFEQGLALRKLAIEELFAVDTLQT
jgi:4,5-dihydroxyphthalate decarboxylase